MAEPTTFPAQKSELVVYRRLSGFAVASIVIACGFALYLAVVGILSLRDHSPLLLPIWVQGLPLMSVGFALAAMVAVRHSEGILTGRKLAAWGLWISVFTGLGYWAYYAATYFAVCQQADAFTVGWFKKIGEGKMGSAFLLTQPPTYRQNINSQDEAEINNRFMQPNQRDMSHKTPMESFREREFVRLLEQAGGQAKITSLGVKEWDYNKNQYTIKRTYRIATEEGVLDVDVPIIGAESRTREYRGRDWYISGQIDLKAFAPSELGQKIGRVRKSSSFFVEAWRKKLSNRDLASAFLDTQDPAARSRLEHDFCNKLLLADLAPSGQAIFPNPAAVLLLSYSFLNPELARVLLLPGYDALFHQAGILDTKNFHTDEDKVRNRVLDGFGDLFRGRRADLLLVAAKMATGTLRETWKIADGKFQHGHDCQLMFANVDGERFQIDATIVVECAAQHLEGGAPDWRVVRFDLFRALDAAKAKGMMNPDDMPGGER